VSTEEPNEIVDQLVAAARIQHEEEVQDSDKKNKEDEEVKEYCQVDGVGTKLELDQ